MSIKFFYKDKYLDTINYACTNGLNLEANISKWKIVKPCRRYYIDRNFNFVKKACLFSIFRIAFILESPSFAEFDCFGKPLHPLNGISGIKFDKNIRNVLKKILGNLHGNFFEINIVNPVRFECDCCHYLNNMIPNNPISSKSKFVFSKDRRATDQIWKMLFNNAKGPNEEKNFRHYLRTEKFNAIVNCCTGARIKSYNTLLPINTCKSNKIADLKGIVRETILNLKLPSCYYCELEHPIVW